MRFCGTSVYFKTKPTFSTDHAPNLRQNLCFIGWFVLFFLFFLCFVLTMVWFWYTLETVKKEDSAPKKSMETEPDFSPVKTLEKVTEKQADAPTRQGDCYVNIGGELPYYLL